MKPLSEQDRAILAKHASGATFRDIAAELGVKEQRVRHVVEHLAPIHARGQAMLAKDPESVEGLQLTGAISSRAHTAIANATYEIDVPDLERLSDVAAQGHECVARFPRVGPGVMAELDALLARFGLTWNPRPRPFAYRTDKNRHPLKRLWDQERKWNELQDQQALYWSGIVRHVDEIERSIGTGVLKDSQGRDSMEGVSYRLAFLSGYLESRAEQEGRHTSDMRDITPDDDGCETAGNLICLPGVTLASIRNDGGDDPGPRAA